MPNPTGNPQNLRQFRSGWRHLPTRQIRVPSVLAEEILRLAKRLDDGQSIPSDSHESLESAINALLSDPTVTRNGRDKGAVKRALSALLEAVKHQTEKTTL